MPTTTTTVDCVRRKSRVRLKLFYIIISTKTISEDRTLVEKVHTKMPLKHELDRLIIDGVVTWNKIAYFLF